MAPDSAEEPGQIGDAIRFDAGHVKPRAGHLHLKSEPVSGQALAKSYQSGEPFSMLLLMNSKPGAGWPPSEFEARFTGFAAGSASARQVGMALTPAPMRAALAPCFKNWCRVVRITQTCGGASSSRGLRSCRGRKMRKVVPCPAWLSSSIRPPWARTMRCTIIRPRPVPFFLVV